MERESPLTVSLPINLGVGITRQQLLLSEPAPCRVRQSLSEYNSMLWKTNGAGRGIYRGIE